MCRKNILKMLSKFASVGSLPRVQEKQCSLCKWWNTIRITPACAGKTMTFLSRLMKSWDHPRVCGKNKDIFLRFQSGLGSPPRVREKHDWSKAFWHLFGITPACAGKTNPSSSGKLETEDHPRVCGKNLAIMFEGNKRAGSPPRVREKRFSANWMMSLSGITPACAGKTGVAYL